ncbi:hypothetical protein EX30DRAFT_340920 [Ascodesmis nigricans]|uniref:Uncharacterized protein n=1 Tax=Ascodesmis nigricans TaxID=341454 RepID=A0A4S2MXD1_9PEZI|nr:hypothetical protein EX30DRAFT_340920 [Ascodesmis nigricans]
MTSSSTSSSVTSVSSESSTTSAIPSPTATSGCSPGRTREILEFDDYTVTNSPTYFPGLAWTYKRFSFLEGWGLANCDFLTPWRSDSCNGQTISGDEYLSLYSRAALRLPTWRKIVFDIEDDFSSFDLVSFLATVPPSTSTDDYYTVAYCGWTVADQDNEFNPTWCRTAVFNQPDNSLVRIQVNQRNLAYLRVFGTRGIQAPYYGAGDVGSDAKGPDAIDFYIDDIEVCV